MSSHTYKFGVQMTCGGCSGAVTRALNKAKDSGVGIDSFDVDLAGKTVVVKGDAPFEVVKDKIAKTGKAITSEEIVE